MRVKIIIMERIIQALNLCRCNRTCNRNCNRNSISHYIFHYMSHYISHYISPFISPSISHSISHFLILMVIHKRPVATPPSRGTESNRPFTPLGSWPYLTSQPLYPNPESTQSTWPPHLRWWILRYAVRYVWRGGYTHIVGGGGMHKHIVGGGGCIRTLWGGGGNYPVCVTQSLALPFPQSPRTPVFSVPHSPIATPTFLLYPY